MGGLVGGLIGGIGKKKAAKQARGDTQAAASGLDSFVSGGETASNFLSQLLQGGGGTGGGEALQRFRELSGERAGLQSGLGAAGSNLASRGLLGSSGAARTFSNVAAERQGDTFNNFLSRLFGQQQLGQSAATNRASLLAGQPTSKGTIAQSAAPGAGRAAGGFLGGLFG